MLSKRTVLTLYALGYLGIAILTQTTVKWYQYYYTPPALNEHGLEVLVPIAFVGIAMVIARIVDGIADPIVAYFSDRSTHPYGRRTPYILHGTVPLVVTFILLWFPPFPYESMFNLIYLTVMLALFFVFFTIVVTPYLALIGELTETKQERIQLTTMQGIAQVVGVIVAEAGSGMIIAHYGFKVMGIMLGFLSLFAILLTPLFVKEKSNETTTSYSIVDSLKLTMKNKNFLFYLSFYIAIWFGINSLTIAMPYMTEILLKKSAETSGLMIGAAFIFALCFSPFIPKIASFMTKKTLLLLTASFFALLLALTGLFGTFISYYAAFFIVLLTGIPLSVIFIIPNAMVADIAEHDSIINGEKREGMFFGAQGLIIKIVIGLSSLVTPFIFHTFGYSEKDHLGLQLIGPISGSLILFGVWFLSRYDLPDEIR